MEKNRKICFDSKKYLALQEKEIREKMEKFDNKLYMEFGGKLLDDFHAARVLPGFESDVQMKLLDKFRDECEIILVVNAGDIQGDKIRADYGITYEMEVERLMACFRERGLMVSGVVITLFENQPQAIAFKEHLQKKGEVVYTHYFTKGYPIDVDTIVSEEGYGKNEYIRTSRPLVVITAPGPGSGKMATCLSQLYHEHKRGIRAGYAKFEKFPVYNLSIKHPINVAYEAATADLEDVNQIDSYHFDSYGTIAVSYNRDLQAFPVLKNILHKIAGYDIYKSPTDMGINNIASCITDDDLARYSAKQEIIRRYLKAKVDVKTGKADKLVSERIKLLMNELSLTIYDRKSVRPAEEKYIVTRSPSVAIELGDGCVVCGRQTALLTASASSLLNALKKLAGIDDRFELLTNSILEPIINLKKNILSYESPLLSIRDVLLALSLCAKTLPIANSALGRLLDLNLCDAHSTHILTNEETSVMKSLKINLTSSDMPMMDK